MVLATRLLDAFSTLVIVIAGVYVEITFAHLLTDVWKLVVAGVVLAHVVLQAERVLLRLPREKVENV